jgi:OFA family oxalate/formate antiporter-like MFS transporter
MAIMSLVICFAASFYSWILAVTLIMIWIVNFFFGCGFSYLPNILHQHYGINQLSTVHGLTLSAWAIAGLSGNQFASYIINNGGPNNNLGTLYVCLGIFYAIELVILLIWTKNTAKMKK